ncbi:MAG: ABC transporter ATP-binding protein [Elusimicrobia bacterium]|nr:ABC transporter ATP-binding protein [Elusimicrobiota bacterium]
MPGDPAREYAAKEHALSFRDVTKTYVRSHLGRTSRFRGIEHLDLDLRPGEIFGLLGLNGSGKTTTIKLALGLLAPTSGSVSIFGHPAGSRSALALMGYLPELPYFYPYLTPREILTFYGRLSGMPHKELEAKTSRSLEKTGIERHTDRRMSDFSKGMLQRVGMAQALLHEPRLLLLDEPVSGLDPLAVAEFRALFSRLNQEGTSLLLSSHSISEVERLCHRAGILVEGRLVKIFEQKDWSKEPGLLETLFVDMIRQNGAE